MPAVPGDAVQVLVVLPEAVEDAVEVGVRAAVVPVPAWCEKRRGASELSVPPLGSGGRTRPQPFVVLV